MNTSDTTSSVAGTPTALFYAIKVLGPENGQESAVIVALNSWLGSTEGWLGPEADILTLPNGTVANLDPSSAHKRYLSVDLAFCDILNVITCPASPDARDTKKKIVDGWKKNGIACVPWNFDTDANKLVLHQVTLHGESNILGYI
jgi:hypothetical protein